MNLAEYYPADNAFASDYLGNRCRAAANDPKKAAFAIECRKVRLWIAAHPGASSKEVKDAIGGRYDMCLARMLAMRIVRFERSIAEDRRRVTRWFVIPQ